MKCLVVLAAFVCLAVASPVDTEAVRAVPTIESVTKKVADAISCALGTAPCADEPVTPEEIIQELGCATGFTPCTTGAQGTRSGTYADGTNGHPLPAEVIAVGRTLDATVRSLLCVIPATCPSNTDNLLTFEVPSIERALESVRTAPAMDPLITLGTCRLGLAKCD